MIYRYNTNIFSPRYRSRLNRSFARSEIGLIRTHLCRKSEFNPSASVSRRIDITPGADFAKTNFAFQRRRITSRKDELVPGRPLEEPSFGPALTARGGRYKCSSFNSLAKRTAEKDGKGERRGDV